MRHWDDYGEQKMGRELVHGLVSARARKISWILPPLSEVPYPEGVTRISEKPEGFDVRSYSTLGLDWEVFALSEEQ